MPTTMSPLRYPGGKTRIYPFVKSLLEINQMDNIVYVEPFAGGAGLALKLMLTDAVSKICINDNDPAIHAFWFSVLYHPIEFCEKINKTAITVEEWKKQRDIYSLSDKDDVLSLGFSAFYLNRTNISGIITGGVIGGLQQTGNNKLDARFTKKSLIEKIKIIAEHKDHILLSNKDAKDFLKSEFLNETKNVFVYLDPPYVNKGAQLYKNSFTDEDHRTLAEIVIQSRFPWIVTYDVCDLVKNLYAGFRWGFLDMNYSANGNRKAKEYIFFSDHLCRIPDITACRHGEIPG